MAKAKTTTKSTTSRTQFEAQQYISRISKEATKIQQEGGKKTVTKTVFKINRADAVKKAAKKVR